MVTGKTLVIGEVGLAHEGSLGMALSYVDSLAKAGVDYAKFQIHFADQESSFRENFRVKTTSQDSSRFDYWLRTSFSDVHWAQVKEHCEEVGVEFLATPFSSRAFDLIENLGCKSVKVGSGDFSNPELMERVASFEGTVFASCGMATMAEIESNVRAFRDSPASLILMQCTSMYPTPASRANILQIPALRAEFGIPVGYSDHSGSIHAGLHAISLGAHALEVHACFDKAAFGIDAPASLLMDEIAILSRHAEIMKSFEIVTSKDEVALELSQYRELFGRSLGLIRDFKAGQQPTQEDFILRKPGGGLSWESRKLLEGKVLARDVDHLELVSEKDFVSEGDS